MEGYKSEVYKKVDQFVNNIFFSTKSFPREEIYITTSQLKRAALSIILNYVEGYARIKKKTQLQFLEISYGSLKETKYLLYFSLKQGFLNQLVYNNLMVEIDQIGAMIWTEIQSLSKKVDTL